MKYFPILCLLILVSSCSSRKESAQHTDIEVVKFSSADFPKTLANSAKDYHILNFYASYCKPCIKELPEMKALMEESKEIEVHLISMDGGEIGSDSLRNFLIRHEIHFPSSYFSSFDSAQRFIKTAYPAWNNEIPLTLVMNKTGKIISTLGITDKKEIEAIVAEDKAFQ